MTEISGIGAKVTHEGYGKSSEFNRLVIDLNDVEAVVIKANGREVGVGVDQLLRCFNWLFNDVDTDIRIMDTESGMLRDEWREERTW
jgi:hypothetical protein